MSGDNSVNQSVDVNISDQCSVFHLDDVVEYWISDTILPIICSIGIVGNITAVFVLSSPFMRTTTFHQSLLFLVLCDVFFLLMTFTDTYIDQTSTGYIIIFPYFWYPVKNTLMCWETYLIMAISTERWLAVCKPLWHRTNSLSHSSRFHLMIYILPSFIIALLFNVPKWMEFEYSRDNVTEEIIDFDVTTLRSNQDYIFYYTHLTRLLFTGLIPFVYLATVNISICSTISKSSQFQFSSNNRPKCNYTICLHSAQDSPEHCSDRASIKRSNDVLLKDMSKENRDDHENVQSRQLNSSKSCSSSSRNSGRTFYSTFQFQT